MAKLVDKKEKNLLIGSKIINDYPNLKKFIQETPNLEDKDLGGSDKELKQFFENVYRKVLNEVVKEWVVKEGSIGYFEGNTMSCELCGNRPINNICTIENKFTGNELKIGTECVKRFGINSDVDINKLLEESKGIKRFEHLDKIFPSIEKTVSRWESFVNNQPILVKKEVKRKYIDEGIRARAIIESYTNPKTTVKECDKLINEMGQVLKRKENEEQRITDYVEKNKSTFLIPDKAMVNRLRTTNQQETIDMIEEDGIIRHKTLHRIKDDKFAESLIDRFNEGFKDFGFIIENLASKKALGYQLAYNKKRNIKLFCTYEDLCLTYYNLITDDEGDEVSLAEMIRMSSIFDEKSVENALYELFSFVEIKGVKLHYIDYEYKEIAVHNKGEDKYYVLGLDRLIERFTQHLFIKQKDVGNELYNYAVKLSKNPMTKKDIDYLKKQRDKA